MKVAVLVLIFSIALAFAAPQDETMKLCHPGPCELTAQVPEEVHGLGDFTPEHVPDTPAELEELYKSQNLTTTEKAKN